MRLAFDVTALHDVRTGVGVVTSELLHRFAATSEIELVAYSVSWRGRRDVAALVPDGVPVVRRPMAAQPLRRLWLRYDAPALQWWTGAIDIVHGPNFVVPPSRAAAGLVTVHDLTCIHHPELCTPDVLQYPALLRRALARGAHIHTVSHFVGDEVVALLGADPDRVHVVPNGVNAAATGRVESGHRHAGGDRYILALGTVEPRKDLPTLVAAFDAVAAEDPELRLVLAGPDGWGTDALVDAIGLASHRDRVVRLGWVSDAQRADLLAGATVFAYPSRYEGFGLPPLDAMAAGVPVVATRAGALPEVLGDAATLVGVGDVDALGGAIAALAAEPAAARATRVEGARRHASRYTWDAAAAALVSVYRGLC
ncbi:MAG: glycosyltransferase family 4 protein [Acidimicrobiales bacterium]